MKTTIRNRGGESTLIISSDFGQILDDNFSEICKAIANKGKILNELISLFNSDDWIIDDIIHIIRSSIDPKTAAQKLEHELPIDIMTAKYLLNSPLMGITSLSYEALEQELKDCQKQIMEICASFNIITPSMITKSTK